MKTLNLHVKLINTMVKRFFIFVFCGILAFVIFYPENSIAQTYCTSSLECSSQYPGIANVNFTGINYSATSCPGTGSNGNNDFTKSTSIGNMAIGTQVTGTVTATASAYSGGYLNVWIDWNHNGTFDAGEQVAANVSYPVNCTGGGCTNSFSATPPKGAYIGVTRMRVMISFSTSSLTCGIDWSTTEDFSINVSPAIICATATSNPGTICNGGSATLSVTSGSSYVWAGGMLSNDTLQQVIVSPTTTTTYTVTVGGVGTCSSQTVVNVNPVPAVIASVDTICAGAGATLSVTASPTGYNWVSNPAGFTSSAQSPVVTPTMTTTYMVSFTGLSGCTASQPVTVNPLPTANAGSPVAVCKGTSTVLTATGGSSYFWSNGSTNALDTVTPGVITTYTVTITSNSCSAISNIVVSVNPLPPASAGNDVTICTGGSMILTATGGTGYAWSNGAITATNAVGPDSTTTYSVTVTSSYNCSATSDVVVSVVTHLVADAGNDVAVCLGNSTILTATGGVTYNWSNGTNAVTNSVLPDTTTIYTVTISSGINCSATDSVVVTVNSLPTVMATGGTICLKSSLDISASGADIYEWSNGANSAIQTVNPTTMTVYIVTGTETTHNCSNTASAMVTVNPLPAANAGKDVAVCQGNSAVLTATGGTTYSWSNGENTATNSVTPNATTTYIVTVTVNNCSAAADIVVTVNPIPSASAGNNVTICQGKVANLTATGGNTYKWNNGTISSTNNVMNITTTYTVTVTLNNCSSSADVVVTVNNNPPIPVIRQSGDTLISNALNNDQWYNSTGSIQGEINPAYVATASDSYYVIVTENGCSSKSNVIQYIITGIATVNDKTGILIYPNPSSGFINIEGNLNNTCIKIINLAGQVIICKNIKNSEKETIDISGMTKGLYFISVNNNGNIQVNKLVKE